MNSSSGDAPLRSEGPRSAIPSYASPPVAEVALAAHFSPPIDLRSVHFGRLWDKWQVRYPISQDQPLLPPVPTEDPRRVPTGIAVQLVAGSPGTRVWYLSEDECHVLQVQRDRLVLNWRGSSGGQEYPRYDTLRPAFEEALRDLLAFVDEERLGSPVIEQAEVTYVNPIPVSSVSAPGGVAGLLAPWSGVHSDGFLAAPEDAQISLRYPIQGKSGGPIGSLYIELRSALHQQIGTMTGPERILLLQLFARGRPTDSSLEGALGFLDLGHEWVVRGFTSVTTGAMHRTWGRER